MNFQFTHPYYLLLLAPALAWVVWFAWKTDVQVSPWRPSGHPRQHVVIEKQKAA